MLELIGISISLAGRTLMAPVSFTVSAGEIVTIMGASGSGKSSLLALIAGDLPQAFTATGGVRLNGRDLTRLPPEQRRIGRLFQDDLLFPHLTVGENLLFGIARGPRAERLQTMRAGLERAELTGHEHAAPHTLSAGQRARVALFRALLAKPDAMLLDEPFSRLDAGLRAAMRTYVFGHLKVRAIPALLVSHDRADAPAGGRILTISPEGQLCDV